jgi:hypothetical protein
MGLVIVRVERRVQQIAGSEINDRVRAGAHRLVVVRRLAGLGAGERREQMLRNEHHLRILTGPERSGRREDDPHGVRIDLFELEIAIAA